MACTLLVALLLASILTQSVAWTSHRLPCIFATSTYLPSLCPAERDNKIGFSVSTKKSNINDGLESGGLLEGGKVINFSSVKANSRAEEALGDARQRLINGVVVPTSVSNGQILGINDDVSREVGHLLGMFATPFVALPVATSRAIVSSPEMITFDLSPSSFLLVVPWKSKLYYSSLAEHLSPS
jgi:hypothetical protein